MAGCRYELDSILRVDAIGLVITTTMAERSTLRAAKPA